MIQIVLIQICKKGPFFSSSLDCELLGIELLVYACACSTVLCLRYIKTFAVFILEEWDQLKVFREQSLVSELRILPLSQGGSKGIDSLVLLLDCRTKKEVIRPHPVYVPFPCTDVNFGLRL